MKKGFVGRYILPLVGLTGIGYALFYTTVLANPPEPVSVQANLPLTSPFNNAISGSGLIEANTRNITVGSHLSGIVSDLLVAEGQEVKAGDPLFRLDDRAAKADVLVRQGEVLAAMAHVEEAKASLADQQDQLARAENLKQGISVTADRVERLRFAVRTADARVGVAKADVEAAKARLNAAQVTLDKLTVTASVDGRILKIGIRKGEFAQAGIGGVAPIVMGNDKPLYVRVAVDENDLWRLRPEAEAAGALRGNRDIKFPLKFVRIEPYVIPKKSLTGDTSERVDTRVLEVIYSIEDEGKSLFIGQQVDVFLMAK